VLIWPDIIDCDGAVLVLLIFVSQKRNIIFLFFICLQILEDYANISFKIVLNVGRGL